MNGCEHQLSVATGYDLRGIRGIPLAVTCAECGQSWHIGGQTVPKQVEGFLKGRARALEDEAGNAPTEALPELRDRIIKLRASASILGVEEYEKERLR